MHVIRLRGPWICQPLARCAIQPEGRLVELATDLPASGSIEMPGDWSPLLGADFRGRARFTRHFNRPSGLESGQQVWLAIDPCDGEIAISLNGVPVIFPRCNIEQWLQPRNELVVEVFSAPAPGRLGLVRLEIE